MSELKEIEPQKSRSNVCIVDAIRKLLALSFSERILSLEIRYKTKSNPKLEHIIMNDTTILRD